VPKDDAETTSQYIGNMLANERAEVRLGENSQFQSEKRKKEEGGGEGGGDAGGGAEE
jgi:hypothetical protein